jgi:PKD repeat protein
LAAHRLHRARPAKVTTSLACPLVGGVVAAVLLASCGVGDPYESDFPVVVVNKTVNTLEVLANGGSVGEVTANQTASFSLKLPESNQNIYVNGVAPTPQAQVTFTAKDKRTGALSAEQPMTLVHDTPTYVTFNTTDFPSTVPTVARFTNSPVNPAINQDVIFNASSSTASNGTYAWDFGDGQTGGGVTITHQYNRAALFTAVLTVTNDRGQSSTASRTINVSAALPPQSANFTFSPITPAINQNVLFTATAEASIVGGNFAWDFGDGGTGNGGTVTHQYPRAGTFTVTLRVNNGVGQTATMSRTITVSANLPGGSANFSFSPTNPGVNDTVFFNASQSLAANASYSWDFGDGSTGSGLTPTHQYARPGTYTVILTVRNDLGQSASTTRTVTVSASSTQLVAAFTFSPTDPTISLNTNTVIFDARDSSANATRWEWDFGDGSTGSGQRVNHTFSRAGTWVVRLTVNDSDGRSATTTRNVTVLASPPPPPSQ